MRITWTQSQPLMTEMTTSGDLRHKLIEGAEPSLSIYITNADQKTRERIIKYITQLITKEKDNGK